MEQRPYPNEHAARIHNPDKYDSFRRKNNEFGDGIHVIYGIKDSKSEVQAIRFDKNKFTVSEAKKWLKDNNWKYISFEPASEEKTYLITCKNCGNQFDYSVELECGMGAVKCPACNVALDQEGNCHKSFLKSFLLKEK